MKKRWIYRFAGCLVSSALELPEWAPFECGESEFEGAAVRFELHPPAPLPDVSNFEVEGVACRFAVPDIAFYEVCEGQTVSITPAPGAGEREIRLFLLGSAWGILCYQRGAFALHAGVVRDAAQGEGCIAFCGASGAGKSSSVAWLVERGFELWSDDLSTCNLKGSTPRVWPSTRRLKLWNESLRALNKENAGLERDHFRQDKFHLSLPTPHSLARAEPLPLRAIYVLEWGETQCMRLRGLQALDAFVEAATYRGSVVEEMGRAALYWEQCAHIARHVPVFRLRRPRDWEALPAALAPVLEYWRA